ncbi:hypothetical protein COO60DRAFT_1699066 [Scenedesmus sp. NREL 46B-D3]|nr:hypothetical protein COO60DRAFT_1699066 [Scenedesmus sp. NREL 46B-D3]
MAGVNAGAAGSAAAGDSAAAAAAPVFADDADAAAAAAAGEAEPAALMDAQDDLLAREAQVKGLQRKQELLMVQLQAQLQQEQGQVEAAAAQPPPRQQRELVEARAALQEAQRQLTQQLHSGMRSVQQEQALVAAADDANAAAAAAAERAAAAEAELIGARAAAESAAAEVAELQQQLQEQAAAAAAAAVSSREHAGSNAAADGARVDAAKPRLSDMQGSVEPSPQQEEAQDISCAAGRTQDLSGQQTQQLQKKQRQQQGGGEAEGSVGFELLMAVSEKQAVQEELADTKQRLLLLLQLVKNAAAASPGGHGKQLQQLPAELAELLEEPAATTGGGAGLEASWDGDAATSADGDAADEAGALLQLASGLEARYCRSEHLQQVLLRGKEMQFLLENALQQVHLIKAAAGVTSCACPSEQEYQQLGAAGRAAAGKSCSPAAAQPAAAAAASPERAGVELGPGLGPGLEPAAGDAVQAGAGAAAVDGGSSSMGLGEAWDEAVQNGAGRVTAGVDARMLTDGGVESDPFGLLLQQPLQQEQQRLEAAGGAGAGAAGAYVGSSCSSDVLRVGATVGSGHGLLDEGLSYDGLEGAWWNKSSVESVTDLPDFLIKKS